MNNTIHLKSFAKVNIGLNVLEKRPDGYHNIETIFQELDYHDSITLSKKDTGCDFSSNVGWLSNNDSNLCVKAWIKFSSFFNIASGISISLEKHIPAGGGLGGGSSNAAAILSGLNKLFQTNASVDDLISIGRTIGADVPFFIQGGTQLGEGVGEKLTKLNRHISGTYLLVIPDVSIDTSWAYSELKNYLDSDTVPHNFANLFRGDDSPLELFENDFELVVIPTYPEIGRIKELIRSYGAKYTSLSGSGSTVFGIFDKEADAKLAESKLSSEYRTILTFPTH